MAGSVARAITELEAMRYRGVNDPDTRKLVDVLLNLLGAAQPKQDTILNVIDRVQLPEPTQS